MYAVLVLLILNIIVVVHEFGHYITAKVLNVKPKTFAVGFGKTLWQVKGKDGVVYKLNLLPFGGYVDFHMAEFHNEKPCKKFLVLFGGIFANLVLAAVASLIFVLIAKIPLDFSTNPIPELPWNFKTIVLYTYLSVANTFDLIFESLRTLLGHPSLNAVAGPIQIVKEGSQLLQQNLLFVLPLLILLDVNVLILNAIPLPALDGGRMCFAVFEMLTRKKVEWEEKLHFAGFVVLMLLMFVVLGKDILVVF